MNRSLLSRKIGGEIYSSRLFPLLNSQFNSWTRFQVIALALGLLSLSFANPVLAQERGQTQMPLRTLTVSGQGVETIPTTLANVRLGVEVQGKTAKEVQQEAARRSSAVVALLRSRNVEKLQTTGISLNPVYSYTNNVQRLTGYSASNIVSFRLNSEQTGTLLDEAVVAGATRIDGISFVASDTAIAAAQQQALREATQDAQQQADTVLAALNLTRREVVSIQVNDASPPQPPMLRYEARAASSDRAVSTPVVGGEQEIEASVTLQISY